MKSILGEGSLNRRANSLYGKIKSGAGILYQKIKPYTDTLKATLNAMPIIGKLGDKMTGGILSSVPDVADTVGSLSRGEYDEMANYMINKLPKTPARNQIGDDERKVPDDFVYEALPENMRRSNVRQRRLRRRSFTYQDI